MARTARRFRVPQATDQHRLQFTDTLTLVRGAHVSRSGGEFQRVKGDFDLGVFRDGRVELVQDFPEFDPNGDGTRGRQRPAVRGHAAQRPPGPGITLPNCDNNHTALASSRTTGASRSHLTLNLGLRYEIDTEREEHQRLRRHQPDRAAVPAGRPHADKNNFGAAHRLQLVDIRAADYSVHGGYGIYYDRVTLEIMSLERGLDGRALPIEVRAGNVFFLDPTRAPLPPFAPTSQQSVHRLHPARRRRLRHQHHRQRHAEPDGAAVQPGRRARVLGRLARARRRHPQPRHALHHRPHDRQGLQPGGGRPGQRREPRVERRARSTTGC